MRGRPGRGHSRSKEWAEFRHREDMAPRLRDAVGHLVSLRLGLRDLRPAGKETAHVYVKPIVVATAPAHFEVPCPDKLCDGRHDLTGSVMRALRASQTLCSGESSCPGTTGDFPCDHTLMFTVEATYGKRA